MAQRYTKAAREVSRGSGRLPSGAQPDRKRLFEGVLIQDLHHVMGLGVDKDAVTVHSGKDIVLGLRDRVDLHVVRNRFSDDNFTWDCHHGHILLIDVAASFGGKRRAGSCSGSATNSGTNRGSYWAANDGTHRGAS